MMNQKLQQAIQATRLGESKKAQYLLTQTIQEDPNDPQAWYLLSLLVDSDEKKAVYLNRVLALDPDHEKAQEKLEGIRTAVSPTPASSTEDADLEIQESSETLPTWMDEDDTFGFIEESSEELDATDLFAEIEPAADVPDWLEKDVVEEWAEADTNSEPEEQMFTPEVTEVEEKAEPEPPQPAPAEKAPAKKPQPKPAAKKKSSSTNFNIILAALIILAVIIGGFLIYLIVTM